MEFRDRPWPVPVPIVRASASSLGSDCLYTPQTLPVRINPNNKLRNARLSPRDAAISSRSSTNFEKYHSGTMSPQPSESPKKLPAPYANTLYKRLYDEAAVK